MSGAGNTQVGALSTNVPSDDEAGDERGKDAGCMPTRTTGQRKVFCESGAIIRSHKSTEALVATWCLRALNTDHGFCCHVTAPKQDIAQQAKPPA